MSESPSESPHRSPASHNSSAVLIDQQEAEQLEKQAVGVEAAAKAAQQQKKETPKLIDRVSLMAVRLSSSAASSVVSAVATAGVMSTSLAPQALVRATTLVADVQAQSMVAAANTLLVHIPQDATTTALLKKLVSQYSSAVNPACLQSVSAMTPGAAAATAALGGALPMVVAAALQETIEVSKLVSGRSNREQFARASAFCLGQLGGGVAGAAIGGAVGSAALPGIGTGIGTLAGSWAGASMLPMLLPADKNNNNNNNNANDDDVQQLSPEALQFFWVEEITSDGWVLISPEKLLDNEAEDSEKKQQQQKDETTKTPEQLRREFEETARALLHRATVVPLSSSASTSPSGGSESNRSDLERALAETPGTVLVLSTQPSQSAFSQQPSSRIFFRRDDEDDGAVVQSEGEIQAELGGRRWGFF